jgi:hypothetical protein
MEFGSLEERIPAVQLGESSRSRLAQRSRTILGGVEEGLAERGIFSRPNEVQCGEGAILRAGGSAASADPGRHTSAFVRQRCRHRLGTQ